MLIEKKNTADLLPADYNPRKDLKPGDKEYEKLKRSKAGDLWQLGEHRLVCGDSTKTETYDLLMNGKVANLVVTDPPYNVNYEGSAGKIKNDNMENSAFYQFLLDAYTQMHSAMAEDASIYVFHADTEGLNFRRRLPMRDFIYPAPASGRSNLWCWAAVLISGSMSRCCSAGRKPENTVVHRTQGNHHLGI